MIGARTKRKQARILTRRRYGNSFSVVTHLGRNIIIVSVGKLGSRFWRAAGHEVRRISQVRRHCPCRAHRQATGQCRGGAGNWIARAEQINPVINAIVHKRARKTVGAGLPEGPLKGVPYLIKDLGFFETGEPATFGSSLFRDFVADHETAYVTRCKKAGLEIGRASCRERVLRLV